MNANFKVNERKLNRYLKYLIIEAFIKNCCLHCNCKLNLQSTYNRKIIFFSNLKSRCHTLGTFLGNAS